MDDKIVEFMNRKAGGVGLVILMLIPFVSLKYITTGWSFSFIFSCVWFTLILITALAVDLFLMSKDSWIYKSLEKIEKQDISKEEKMELIRNQLSLAVERYNIIFFMSNDFTDLIRTIREDLKRILNGTISVKELLVLLAYAMYDLVIRDGAVNLAQPWDKFVIYFGIIVIKLIDAQNGFASIISRMYKEIKIPMKTEEALDKMTEYIKQLTYLFDRETCPTTNINTSATQKIEYKRS